MTDQTPTLTGLIHAPGPTALLTVWCRWCCDWHAHGLADGLPGDTTHRTAHCWAPDSPYKKTGYYILISDTPWSTFERSYKTANRVQQACILDGRITTGIERLRNQPTLIG